MLTVFTMILIVRTAFTAEDLEKIEKEMKKIVKEALPLERFTKSREEAIAFFKEKEEPYKVELIKDLPGRSRDQLLQTGRIYRSLCRATSDVYQDSKSI